ncbi:MAG: hypothetical protein WB557_14850 [Solirubrobacteraceae bacterium]
MDGDSLARGRQAFWLTAGALASGAGLIVGAFVVPVYSRETASAPSGVVHGLPGQTLIQVNGVNVLFVIGAPVAIAALVWIALHHQCSRGGAVSGYLAWTLIAILGAGCVLGILSVGVFMMPVAVLLACAAALTPRPLIA